MLNKQLKMGMVCGHCQTAQGSLRQGKKGVVLWSHLMVVRGIVSLGQWFYIFSYLNPDKFPLYKDIVFHVYMYLTLDFSGEVLA